MTSILRSALIQSISTTLSGSSFPITATNLYSTYILPSRPFFPPGTRTPRTPIDIKNSSHKTLTAFLKSLEKDGLLKLKEQKIPKSKAVEVVVTGVSAVHGEVLGHRKYTTIREEEERRARREEREESERSRVGEMGVVEYWKAWQTSVPFFEEAGGRWVYSN